MKNLFLIIFLSMATQLQAQSEKGLAQVKDSLAWLGVWDVASGKMVRSEEIPVNSSSDLLTLDRDPSSNRILCQSSNGIWLISKNEKMRSLISEDHDESETIWHGLSRFIPEMECVLSIGFKVNDPRGRLSLYGLNSTQPPRFFDLGPIGYRLAVLRNGKIAWADGNRIRIIQLSTDGVWEEQISFVNPGGKIWELKGLGDANYIAVWSEFSFSVMNLSSGSSLLTLNGRVDSWTGVPALSPDRKSIVISERGSNGNWFLSIYYLGKDATQPSNRRILRRDLASSISFSPSGQFIAIGHNSDVQIFSLSNRKLLKTLRIPKVLRGDNYQSPIVIYSADGRTLFAVFINPQC